MMSILGLLFCIGHWFHRILLCALGYGHLLIQGSIQNALSEQDKLSANLIADAEHI